MKRWRNVVCSPAPIGNVIALLPPYCMATVTQARQMVKALREGIEEIFPPKSHEPLSATSKNSSPPRENFRHRWMF